MRITEKGQVTIPIKLRKRFGLNSNTEVDTSILLDVLTDDPAHAPQ
jgi:AbrB family looped-hinge helix DNA binding protein